MNLLRRIFRLIVEEPWFSPKAEDQQAFAAYIIQTYFRGMSDPDKLHAFCYTAARARYDISQRPSDAPEPRTAPLQ